MEMTHLKKLYILLLFQGIYSQFIQAVLLRELITRFSGIELTFAITISSAILWTAAGCAAASKFRLSENRDSIIAISLCLSPLTAILAFVFSALAPPVLSGQYEFTYQIDEMLSFCFLAPMPFGIINGGIYGFITQAAKKSNSGVCYSVDALGDTIGGLLFSFVLAQFAPPLAIAGLTGVFLPLSVLILFRPRKKIIFIGVLAALFSCFAAFKDKNISFSRWNKILPGFEYKKSIETAYGRVDFIHKSAFSEEGIKEEQTAIYCDGALLGTIPQETDISMPPAMFAALQPIKSKLNVLLISSVFSDLPRLFLKMPIISHIDMPCPDKRLFNISRSLGIVPSPSERFNIIFSDERAFLERRKAEDGRQKLEGRSLDTKDQKTINNQLSTINHQQYDLIIVLDHEPDTLAGNRFFTKEFYSLVSEALSPGGAFITSMRSAGGYSGYNTKIFNACILKTIKQVFPEIAFTSGEEKFIAAGTSSNITADFTELDKRLGKLMTDFKEFPSGMMSVAFSQSEQKNESSGIAAFINRAAINMDTRPFLPVQYLGLYSRITSGDVEKPGFFVLILERTLASWKWILTAILTIYCSLRIFFLWLKGKKTGFYFSSFENGFYAMGIEILLLFLYQTRCGALYKDIAAALAIFIAGTALGAWTGEKYHFRKKSAMILFLLASLVPLFLLPLGFILSQGITQILIFILLFTSGSVVGFTYSLLNRKSDAGLSGASLWGWEMAGGAVGAIFFAMFLMPAGGFIPCIIILSLGRLVCFSQYKQASVF